MKIDPKHKSWKPGMNWREAVDEMTYLRELANQMGGEERVKRQHDGGRLTVRERIDKLLDPGSFIEMGQLMGLPEYDEQGDLVEFTPGGFVMGLGEIAGRSVAVGGDDFTISGGSPHGVRKVPHQFVQPLALQYGIPYVQLREGVGHSSKRDEQEGHMGLPQGDLWYQGVELLSKVPVAAGIMGSVAGWPAAAALMSHFTVMVRDQSQIFPSGPPVVERAIGEKLSKEELGGYKRHVIESGQVDNVAENELDALEQIKAFLSYLPDTTADVAAAAEIADVEIDDDESGDDSSDEFLEDDDEESGDVSGIIGGVAPKSPTDT